MLYNSLHFPTCLIIVAAANFNRIPKLPIITPISPTTEQIVKEIPDTQNRQQPVVIVVVPAVQIIPHPTHPPATLPVMSSTTDTIKLPAKFPAPSPSYTNAMATLLMLGGNCE
ncbi:unnamed protein product [Linum trigynum]|uniref:Uncharacterized protein n=1 Tax=Linum trigynum TaxID=586398 RepID=A0AAV2CSU7_9ROSI